MVVTTDSAVLLLRVCLHMKKGECGLQASVRDVTISRMEFNHATSLQKSLKREGAFLAGKEYLRFRSEHKNGEKKGEYWSRHSKKKEYFVPFRELQRFRREHRNGGKKEESCSSHSIDDEPVED